MQENHLFRLPGVAIVEVDPPVDALVRTLLAFSRSSANQTERPPLELVWVGRGQGFGVWDRHRFPNHLVGLLDIVAVGVSQSVADQCDRQVCYVDADPPPPECLSYGNGRAAAAERIEHDGTFVTAGRNDAGACAVPEEEWLPAWRLPHNRC